MEFSQMKVQMRQHMDALFKNAAILYEAAVDKDTLWNLYLDSFPPGANEIYRERREHDCSCCRHFIKNFGNVVVLKGNKIHTIWDFITGDDAYQTVVNALSAYIKSQPIADVYITKDKFIGTDKNFEKSNDGTVRTWDHFYAELPNNLINNHHASIGEIKGEYRDSRNVFKRSLDEITEESLLTVLELIAQKSLYKGEEWESALNEFLKHKKAYAALKNENEQQNYTWEQSVTIKSAISRIRNHSIGTLLTNISEDMDLDEAVRKYEVIVAPTNYKRPKAIFSKKMLEDARKTLEQLGYMDALERRYAQLDDITVNNILFTNKDSAKRIAGADIFSEMAKDIPLDAKKFSKVEGIGIEDFITNVLPTAKEIEILLENKHASNMVSLIAPQNQSSKPMFKWDNSFCWAYSGNITDSNVRENVKKAGGSVDGVLRFSVQWNDAERDQNDLDAHCLEPNGDHICFSRKRDYASSGVLDVDIIHPANIPAVENITWSDKNRMPEGVYQFYVHCYTNRGGKSGFRAEVEFEGKIFAFDYNEPLMYGERVNVAHINYHYNSGFAIKELLQSNVSSRNVWNIKTNQFTPVSVVMYSPNYWNAQQGIGHRHYFFMLKDCVNPEHPNGFYNEYLKEDLMPHKRVFEALGGKMSVQSADDQLSGVGFSATKRNEAIVKVKGQTERVLKIKF
jgi:hypothetical protein